MTDEALTKRRVFNASFFCAPLLVLLCLESTLWIATKLLNQYQDGFLSVVTFLVYLGIFFVLPPWAVAYYLLVMFYLAVAWRSRPLSQEQEFVLGLHSVIVGFYIARCLWWNIVGNV
jgi:ABC-type molybdate transport system permease subunit